MYASSADTSTIRQKETRKQVLNLAHHSKNFHPIAHARREESDWSILIKLSNYFAL